MRIASRIFIAIIAVVMYHPFTAFAQQPTVLAELFQNVNCEPCGVADPQYDAYVSSHPGVVVINYHNSTGDLQDTFFVASLPSSNDRDIFYGGPLNDPNAFIDGFAGLGGSEKTWEQITTSDLSLPMPVITPSLSESPEGVDTIRFSVVSSSSTEVVAYVAIKESNLYYDNPHLYGKPAGNLWNDVFRTMLPTSKGSTPFTGTQNFTVIYDPSNYSYFGNKQNMSAVIFVQDVNAADNNHSHQIEALGTISLAGSDAVEQSQKNSTHLMIPVNPMNAQGHLGFALVSPAETKVVVSDLLGRQVLALADGWMPAGETSVEMNVNVLPAGCYIVRLIVDGREADHAMLVIE